MNEIVYKSLDEELFEDVRYFLDEPSLNVIGNNDETLKKTLELVIYLKNTPLFWGEKNDVLYFNNHKNDLCNNAFIVEQTTEMLFPLIKQWLVKFKVKEGPCDGSYGRGFEIKTFSSIAFSKWSFAIKFQTIYYGK